MTTDPFGRHELLQVSAIKCPHCPNTHSFDLELTINQTQLMVEGKRPSDTTIAPLRCPDTGRPFDYPLDISLGPHEMLTSVKESTRTGKPGPTVGDSSLDAPLPTSIDWRQPVLIDSLKDSLRKGRDYCSLMLSTSMGAIPVFFAVAHFLTSDVRSRALIPVVIVPPALWLVSAAIFAVAIRPSRGYPNNMNAFWAWRTTRVRRTSELADWGTGVFLIGAAAAVAAFIVALAP